MYLVSYYASYTVDRIEPSFKLGPRVLSNTDCLIIVIAKISSQRPHKPWLNLVIDWWTPINSWLRHTFWSFPTCGNIHSSTLSASGQWPRARYKCVLYYACELLSRSRSFVRICNSNELVCIIYIIAHSSFSNLRASRVKRL